MRERWRGRGQRRAKSLIFVVGDGLKFDEGGGGRKWGWELLEVNFGKKETICGRCKRQRIEMRRKCQQQKKCVPVNIPEDDEREGKARGITEGGVK